MTVSWSTQDAAGIAIGRSRLHVPEAHHASMLKVCVMSVIN